MSRRQETLKTIDQIHQEAEMEAIQEKEMMRSLQPVSGKQYQRDEKKRGKEGGHFHLCMYWTTLRQSYMKSSLKAQLHP